MVLMGLSLSSGIGATILLGLNMLVWAVLTFWIGSMLAFIGLGLIVFALRPWKAKTEEAEGADIEPAKEDAQAELA